MKATGLCLTATVAVPAIGAAIARLAPAPAARAVGMTAALLTLAAAIPAANTDATGLLRVDDLSALPLLFTALLSAALFLALPRLPGVRGAVPQLLAVEAVTLATFARADAGGIALLWLLGLAPLWGDLPRPARAYLLVGGLLMGAGALLPPEAGVPLILAAAALRQGIVPLHSWVPALFARAPLPAALLLFVPQVGVYAAARLAGPSPLLGAAALVTAVYAAGLALVQPEARRAFGWLSVSQASLVLVGIHSGSVAGAVGGLSLWLSGSLALAGFGISLMLLEARRGALGLDRFHGGAGRKPLLAAGFLLLGLCAVGFPGTLGFIGEELLVDGTVGEQPEVGVAVAAAAVLNGILVLRMYFRLFCGAPSAGPTLPLRPRELGAVVLLTAAVVAAGLWPGPILESRTRAARQIHPAAEFH